jgi:predicted Na+-dependent transporter
MARRRRKSGGLIGYLVIAFVIFAILSAAFDEFKKSRLADLLPTILIVLMFAVPLVIGIGTYVRHRRRRREQKEYELALEAARDLARQEEEARAAALLEKYGDAAIVAHIMSRDIWHDMTKEQLLDSWGHPEDVTTTVLKTKIKETYKYGQTGKNKFSKWVMIENDVVVGWKK